LTSQWSYTVTHYDEDDSWSSTDITSEINSMPLVTDTGTGDVNSARIILSANNGKFIKTNPVIDQYDRIRIQIDDGDSTTTNYDKYFDVIKILPSESKSEGTRLELFLMGLEYHLQKINYIKPHYFEGAYEVMEDVGNQYNDSHGTQQPTLLGHDSSTYNELPTKSFQRNNYDYGSNELPCYDRMNEVADSLAMAVSEGGALDFYDFKFVVPNTTTYPSNDPKTHIMLKAFSSGNNIAGGSQKMISDSTSVNVGETDSGIDNETGTVVLAWGAAEAGSLPIAYSQFASEEIRYPLYPEWLSTEIYKQNSKVQYQGELYRSVYAGDNENHTPPGSGSADSYWDHRTKDEDYGALYQYSQWTDNLNDEWKDSGTDPDDINSSGELGPGFNDGNMVIWDTGENWFRTWADVRDNNGTPNPSNISSDATLKKYLYNDDTFYRGFRVLIENAVSGSSGKWQGSDKNGKSFSYAIVECITPGTASTAEWIVKYVGANNLSCIVRHDGIPFRNVGGSTWTATGTIDGVSYGANTDGDCLHPYDSLTNEEGIYGSTFSASTDSALKVSYTWQTGTISGSIADATQKHKAGAWLNFNLPFPHAEINGNIDVGFWYGGGASGRDAVCEPATLDVENMHMSPQGYRGFNNGDTLNTECFGQISSIDFWLKLDYQARVASSGAYTSTTEPNIGITCLIIDQSDNVAKQDFIVPFNKQWLPYKLPISGFQTYRGRKPKDSLIDAFIPPKDLTINNQIEWRNIKQIILQTTGSYDSFGRYCDSGPTGNFFANQTVLLSGLPGVGFEYRKLDMYIDAFHFTKPLLVSTGQDTSKDIESDFMEKPEVFDYFQLKNIAEAERQKRKFRHVEFEVNTTGKFDIEFGDYFKFKHARLISDGLRTGTDGGINYIELVAKRIEYSITKPVDGKGGFLRKILGVRRFE